MDSVNAPFLGRLAALGAGAVIPKGSAETQGENPVGAGPLKFVRREFGNEVELERFDDYWNGAACIDRLIAREVTEPTVRLTGLRTGRSRTRRRRAWSSASTSTSGPGEKTATARDVMC